MRNNENHLEEGNQQHPIIFGKSKDSILVPDYLESGPDETNASSTSTTTTTTAMTVTAMTTTGATTNNQMRSKCQLAGNNKSGFYANDADFAQLVTTRVLTDENGHSIKIRVASPPPQRQAQLAKLHKLALQQQQGRAVKQQVAEEELRKEEHQQQQQQRAGQRASVVSQHSDSPLMWEDEQRQVSDSSEDSELPIDEEDEDMADELAQPNKQRYGRQLKKKGERGEVGAATEVDGEQADADEEEEEEASDEGYKCQLTTGDNRHRLKQPAALTYVCQSCFGLADAAEYSIDWVLLLSCSL